MASPPPSCLQSSVGGKCLFYLLSSELGVARKDGQGRVICGKCTYVGASTEVRLPSNTCSHNANGADS